MEVDVNVTRDTNIVRILDSFDAEIQKRKYTNHSWTRFVLDGQAKREGLKSWAIQKYYQTYLQIPIFSILHSRSDSMRVRKFMVDQLIDEESELRSGCDTHYGLMRRFALALGATDTEIDTTAPAPAVLRYVESIKDICRTEHPVVVLTAMYAGESQTAEVVGLVLVKLREQFKLSDHDLEWFVVHAGDDAHSDAERDLIIAESNKVSDFGEAGLRVIDRFMTEWGLLQDYYWSITIQN